MRVLKLVLAAGAACALAALGMVGWGWLTYLRLEKSIVEKMDQYYLTISNPGQEEYLLESDEIFDVPYMASRLSADPIPTRILDAQDRLIGEFSSEKGVYVRDPDELPAYLKKALVATEDRTFYEHQGVNYKAIARAIWVDLKSLKKKQGGSTLTQQLAKLMFTTRKKTYGRKIFEVLCAKKLETKFTKDQILLMYFNFVYFGQGCFGVESAAQYYFGKHARDLDLAESALLAGIIASPRNYSPYQNLELAKARHKTVLARMAANGFIPEADVERFWSDFWNAKDERLKTPEVSFWRMKVNEAPYAVEQVRRALDRDYSKDRILKGGLVVRTTFDLEVQKAAQKALREGLQAENRAAKAADAKGFVPLQAGLAAIDPKDGAILALVGGQAFDFSNQLNRAVDIQRPIGSSVKPFIWAVALESGKYKPDDKFMDAPVHFDNPGGKRWSPHNFNNKYYGEVTLTQALRHSLNSVAINLLHDLPIGDVIKLLSEAAGAPKDDFPRNLTLALGTADLSPLQSAAAYAIFANGGHTVAPYYIREVADRGGNVLRDGGPRPAPKTVLSTRTCSAMIEIMQGVFGPEGSAYPAAKRTGFSIPAAGKTGTTNEYRDAWFAGVTPDLAASVWLGHDDMRLPLEHGHAGGTTAAPIWMNFVKAVYRARPTREFELAVSTPAR